MLTIAGSAGLHSKMLVIQNTFTERLLYKSFSNGKSCDSALCVFIIRDFTEDARGCQSQYPAEKTQ